jgi:hypothetical protein
MKGRQGCQEIWRISFIAVLSTRPSRYNPADADFLYVRAAVVGAALQDPLQAQRNKSGSSFLSVQLIRKPQPFGRKEMRLDLRRLFRYFLQFL